MRHAGPKSEQHELPEWMRMSLVLSLVALLFAACIIAPIFLAKSFGVWFGLLGAVAGLLIWMLLIRPMPGFFAGIIALWGLFALVGALVVWIIRVIRYVAA